VPLWAMASDQQGLWRKSYGFRTTRSVKEELWLQNKAFYTLTCIPKP
jgi:hypothetical protein